MKKSNRRVSYNPQAIIEGYCKMHSCSGKMQRLAVSLGEWFEDYQSAADLRHDIACIMDYAPDYVNSGCFAVYYSDIEDACVAAGYKAGQSSDRYSNYYNRACLIALRALRLWAYERAF